MAQLDQAQLDRIKKAEKFREENKRALPGKIVCAGSSLMEMFPINKFLAETGNETVIYNRGIGGYQTKDLLENLDVCVLDLKPSRLFINIGTNDLSWASISIAQLIDSYDRILTEIQRHLPDAEIYVMAYFPVNYEAASPEMRPCLQIRTNVRIGEANKALERLACKHGARYIDINAGLQDEQGRLKAAYTIEGMHVKEEGYRAIFEDFMRYAAEPAWKKVK